MNNLTTPSRKLTHNGIRKLIDAAVDKADEMGVPMGVAIANEGARIVGYLLMDGARVLAHVPEPRIAVYHLHALAGFNVGGEMRDQVGGRQWLEEDERNVVETIRLLEIFLQDQVNVVNRRFFRLKHGPKHGLNVGLIMIRRNTRKKYGRNLSRIGSHD